MERFAMFSGSILELNRHFQKVKDAEMRALGLRGSHVMPLYYLGRSPDGLTITELAEVCKEDKAAISRAITELTEKGYVYRKVEEPRRVYRAKLCLTEAGERLVQYVYTRIDFALTRGSQGLSEEQRRVFYSTVELILKNLSDYNDPKSTT